MAHFAKLGPGNKVLEVIVVHDNEAPTEAAGIEFLETIFGKGFVWKQTWKGRENNPRKNYGGRGYQYDKAKEYVAAGGKLDAIKNKYKLTAVQEKELNGKQTKTENTKETK